uniref:Uncharacterized protein n=1 Tax=Glycine max TaxID=3847 RepID=C6T1J4_SOYBN|nr:unknown [Glycine max]
MSKKNNLAKRKKQYEFDLQREKQEKIKKEQKLHAKKNKMKVDGSDKKKKGGSGFQVGKREVKTKLTALLKLRLPRQWSLTNEHVRLASYLQR